MKKIDVPYFSQRDNYLNPYGACNVTSVAMALWHFGIRGDGSFPQLEDQLYQRCEDSGLDRHDPYDLASLVRSYGMVDQYTDRGSLADIRQCLDGGSLAVVHSFATESGHIFLVAGYDDDGFYCNDPYGEWSPWNYSDVRRGSYYSNRMVGATCGSWSYPLAKDAYSDKHFDPEGIRNIYLHRING